MMDAISASADLNRIGSLPLSSFLFLFSLLQRPAQPHSLCTESLIKSRISGSHQTLLSLRESSSNPFFLALGLGLGFHSSFYYEPDGDKSNLAIWFRKSDNAEAAHRHGLDDPRKNPKARLFVLGFVFVFDHPELQIQAGHPGGEEGRIQYARAHMEAHELQVSGVRIAGHGVLPQVAKRRRSEG